MCVWGGEGESRGKESIWEGENVGGGGHGRRGEGRVIEIKRMKS